MGMSENKEMTAMESDTMDRHSGDIVPVPAESPAYDELHGVHRRPHGRTCVCEVCIGGVFGQINAEGEKDGASEERVHKVGEAISPWFTAKKLASL